MPINEIEHHPFLNYHLAYNQSAQDYHRYNSLILGSYPVYWLTTADDSLPRAGWEQNARFRFFYGSTMGAQPNRFWEYFLRVYNQSDVLRPNNTPGRVVHQIEQVLEENGYIISDVIKTSNRNGHSSQDIDLFYDKGASPQVMQLFEKNTGLIPLLFDCRNIKYIYFTALPNPGKTPFGWFLEILDSTPGLSYNLQTITPLTKSITLQLNGTSRELRLFFLYTPSSNRGIHMGPTSRHPSFLTYLQHYHPTIYNQLPSLGQPFPASLTQEVQGVRQQYIKDVYKAFFGDKNLFYPYDSR